jgi:hypothetical protein
MHLLLPYEVEHTIPPITLRPVHINLSSAGGGGGNDIRAKRALSRATQADSSRCRPMVDDQMAGNAHGNIPSAA